MGGKLICCFVEVPALNGEAHAQRNDFKWAHIEVDGPPVVGEHWCRTVGRLFQQIDSVDTTQRHLEAQRGAPAIAVRLVEAEDEPVSVSSSFETAERERQTVEVEEVIHSAV